MQTVPYQLCPKCNGEKKIQTTLSTTTHTICDICNGKGIIAECLIVDNIHAEANDKEILFHTSSLIIGREQELRNAIRKRFGRLYQSHIDIIESAMSLSITWCMNDLIDFINELRRKGLLSSSKDNPETKLKRLHKLANLIINKNYKHNGDKEKSST